MKSKIITLFLLVSAHFLMAQNPEPPQNFFLGLEPIEEINMDAEDPMAEPDLTGINHKITAFFGVADTLNIANIHIKLGYSEGTAELFDSSFVFDHYELAEDQQYIREGENLSITIGVFEWNPEFFAELKLEDHNGEFSETVSYTID